MTRNVPPLSKTEGNENFLTRFFHRILSFCYHYPRTNVILFVSLLGLSFYGISKIQLELDIYDVKDVNFSSSSNWFTLRSEFKDPNSLYFIWTPSDRSNTKAHCEWQNVLQKTLNEEMLITRIFHVYGLRAPHNEEGDLLYRKILPDPCDHNWSDETLQRISFSYWRPVIVDKNQKSFITEVSFEGDIENDEVVDIKEIERISQTLMKENKRIDPAGEIRYLGPLSYRLEFKKILAKDGLLNIGLLVFIIAFFRAFLGTWSSGLVYSLATVLTMILTVGLCSLMGHPLDILSNNLILMTAIAGTADFLFLTLSFKKNPGRSGFYKIITPAFFTTFTTMVGFLSLYTSDLVLIRRFGITAAIGAFFEWAVLFMLFPSLRAIFKMEKTWINEEKAFKITTLKKLLEYTPTKKVTYLFLTMASLAFVSWPYLNYADAPKNNFPEKHILRRTIESFTQQFGWEGNISLLFHKNVSLEEREKILNKLKSDLLVFYIEDKKLLLETWTKEFEAKERKELITRDFESSALNKRFESHDYYRSILYLKKIHTNELEFFQKSVEKICGDKCFLSGQVLVYLELNKRVSYTMLESFLTSIFLVLIVLFTLMKILKVKGARFIEIVLSSLVGPLFMLTVMVVLQVPVNIVTSIFFAAMVGLTGDNAIQYLFAGVGRTLDEGIDERGDGSLIFAILLVTGSLFFIGQTLIPLKWLGFLLSLGFLINFVGDYWILKGLKEQKKSGT